jgi:hypothetical protein
MVMMMTTEDVEDAHDLMSAHSRRIAEARYARLGGLTKNLTSESIELFRNISDRWQSWFNLLSRQPKDIREVTMIAVEEESIEEKVKKVLCRLYGASGKFRSEQQKEAVIATAKGISPLFIILPTGTGKSLTFLLPALFDDANTTIVITPLVALAEDILRRCQDAMIDAIIYGRVQARMARIVIVVTETAVNSSFSQFILDIYLAKKLDRIVFDEAHKLETDLNYRPKLKALRKLGIANTICVSHGDISTSSSREIQSTMAN